MSSSRIFTAGLVFAVCAAAACAEDAGRFRIYFNWAEERPAGLDDAIVFATVRSRETEQTIEVRHPLATLEALHVPQVPYGRGWFVEIKIRRDDDEESCPLYYGRSVSFDLQPGDDQLVSVEVPLRPLPRADGRITVAGTGGYPGIVNNTSVELAIEAEGLVAVYLRNAGNDGAGERVFLPLPEPTLDYDLDRGVVPACDGASGPCARPIIARFEDAHGVLSCAAIVEVTLDRRPPAANRVDVVYRGPSGEQERAGSGGANITLTVGANEPLARNYPAALTANHGDRVLSFAGPSWPGDEKQISFTATVPLGLDDGIYTAEINWADLAGNATTSTLSGVNVKTSTPTLIVAQDEVWYLRGHSYLALVSATAEDASFLPKSAFRFADDRELKSIKIGSLDTQTASALPADQGWRTADLFWSSPDAHVVYVTGLDLAGNESPPVAIENSWLIAAARSSDDERADHHLRTFFSAREYLDPDRAEGVKLDDAAADGADGQIVWLDAGTWTKHEVTSTSPSARDGSRMVYDSARGRMILFGGLTSNLGDISTETWEWDGHIWKEGPPISPGARRFFALAYDAARGVTVLFGGLSDGDYLGDTWVYNGGNEGWKQLQVAGPPGRNAHAMAYDSRRRRVVLFGGKVDPAIGLRDIWEWDGETWEEIEPPSRPRGRWNHAMAYDGDRGVVVLFGGQEAHGDFDDETWEWNGTTWTRTATIAAPAGRVHHALTYDSQKKRVILAGGRTDSGPVPSDELWEYDGATWTQRIFTEAPPARHQHAVAYDHGRDRLVVFGGAGSNEIFLGDSWELDGELWTEHRFAGSPFARRDHALVYDAARKRTLLFGGISQGELLDDIWEWNGQTWREKTPADRPPARKNSIAVYDQQRERVVFFGGENEQLRFFGDTWEWDGENWTQQAPALSPAARSKHAMAYDPSLGETVLFGGITGWTSVADDLWTWNGSDWTPHAPATTPGPRSTPVLAYHQARLFSLLFDGSNGSPRSSTFTLDHSLSWRELAPVPAPPPRWAPAMTYDERRGRAILFGGDDLNGSPFGDTWESDGSTWIERTITGAPEPRLGHGMTYDSRRDRVVLFGGDDYGLPFDGVWELSFGAPAVQLDVSLPVDIALEKIRDIRVRAFCRGVFDDGAAASLYGWSEGAWTLLGTSTSTAAIPHPQLTIEETRRLIFERTRSIHVQCRPAENGGSTPARVGLDYLEVRVRYEP